MGALTPNYSHHREKCEHIHRVGQNHMYTVYDRIIDDFPAKNILRTPNVYGSGQPCMYNHSSRTTSSLAVIYGGNA